MSMRLLFIIDPLSTLNPAKDSTIAMMRAAQARGHENWVCTVDALSWESAAGVFAEAQQLDLTESGEQWHLVLAKASTPIKEFDAIVMRKDPPFDVEYISATWMLEQAEREGARVFNRPAALRDHSEKFSLAEFSQFAPKTLVTRSPTQLSAFIDREGDTILKPLDGMGGRGIFRVRSDDPNRNVIIEMLSENGGRSVMAQRFLPGISAGDKRILLIGGEVVPWCLARIPKAGESRGNLAAGGTGVVQALTDRDREIAEALAPTLAARGLLLVGLDVIGEHLTEINVTSPTCMVEIKKASGFDAADLFVKAVERACASSS